ncbi:apolipoprotein N-acyltransferase [Vannielia litorea]|uniref:apolipoprotein N-acyltransferase n=1 Tax=Vannielia litorea TaxID=1217970 RepID=UPI001C987C00|nr:apolipoprotein N-acyltransferase [Vannielia litorea]MBY6048513.1 apolipoprotein N-acyltransferase [Vannielia litorea]MBY6075927.1 apolipoprotein N-acyltransferase [Vannielia litorea]
MAGWLAGRWSSFVLFALLGALVGTGQAPLGFVWLAVAAFALAFALFALVPQPKAAAWRGWAMGVGYVAATMFWIVEPFFVDPWRHGWMAPFALAAHAGGFALFWGLAFGAAAALGRGRWHRALWAAVLLAATEMLRAHLWTGFPWALLGHIWIGQPQMHLAALGGPHALTLFTTLAVALPTVFGLRRAALGVITAIALLALPVPYGLWRLGQELEVRAPATVRLVQPNAPQHLKWQPEMRETFFNRGLALSAEVPEGPQPDLVVWPETSVAYFLAPGNGTAEVLADAARGAMVVVGIQRLEGDDARNSLAVVTPGADVTDIYNKSHLVPFGEYMPGASWLGRWAPKGLAEAALSGFVPGNGLRLIDLGEGLGEVLPLICYEAIFAEEIIAAPRPDWVLHITNDAWFGTVSGPYQHLAQARLRAVEQGVPVLRSANTGVSAVIDAQGRVLDSLALGEAGFIDVALPPRLAAAPPYRIWGDWGVMGLLILLGLVLAAIRPRAVQVDPKDATD